MKINFKPFYQVTIAFILVSAFSMCDDPEIVNKKITRGLKEYPKLDSAIFTRTIPIFSQWDLACGACDWSDSLSNFNSLTPEYSGANKLQCGHAAAGCVAVAMGQILNHWKTPSIIDWSKIKDTCSTRETAKLLRMVGDSLGMWYNANAAGDSGIPFNEIDRITHAFNNYGFTAEYGDFNLNRAITELDNNRPIILIACTEFFCHAWITTAYAIDNEEGYHLYMNWGVSFNQWCPATKWAKGNSVFDRKKTMVYNIRPF